MWIFQRVMDIVGECPPPVGIREGSCEKACFYLSYLHFFSRGCLGHHEASSIILAGATSLSEKRPIYLLRGAEILGV